MINEELLDFTNQNLLDSNIVGKRRNVIRSRSQFYSNADADTYVEAGKATMDVIAQIANRPRNEAKDAAKMKKKQLRQEKRAAKKDVKMACGRKPLLKKKRGAWDKCVADYMKEKKPTTPPVESSELYKKEVSSLPPKKESPPIQEPTTEKKFLGMPQTTGIIVTLVAVGVLGFIGYKMFTKGGGAAAAAPSTTPVG